jgi:hypothetical protein
VEAEDDRVEAEDRWIDMTVYIRPFYHKIIIFSVLDLMVNLVFYFFT